MRSLGEALAASAAPTHETLGVRRERSRRFEERLRRLLDEALSPTS